MADWHAAWVTPRMSRLIYPQLSDASGETRAVCFSKSENAFAGELRDAAEAFATGMLSWLREEPARLPGDREQLLSALEDFHIDLVRASRVYELARLLHLPAADVAGAESEETISPWREELRVIDAAVESWIFEYGSIEAWESIYRWSGFSRASSHDF